jgi:hypothetical protein
VSTGAAEQQGTGFRGALAALRRTFAPADHLALWTVTLGGSVVGTLMREGAHYRLDLFDRDTNIRDLIAEAGDTVSLEQALSERLGGEVRLHAVAG